MKALVIGVGGLGSPAATALAHAGVSIGICDDDEVELSNLHRQILFGESDVGAPKVAAAARALQGMGAAITAHATRLLPDNAVSLVSRYDVVLEGSDNFATKFLACDACAIARVPVVHAAAVRWHGTVLASVPGGACYRCLFEDLPRGEAAASCAEAGVIGPVVGVLGAVQADLALALLAGVDVGGTLVSFDGKTGELRRRTISRRATCGTAESIEPERYF